MNTKKHIDTEKILTSLDQISRVPAPDFFYTRLKARLENEVLTPVRRSGRLQPMYAFAALLLVLLINAAVILKGNISNNENLSGDSDISQSIAAEYSINTNLTYEINQ